jgi:8-oxo-dGTP pyrophosphatase MutT (NUDIX family)
VQLDAVAPALLSDSLRELAKRLQRAGLIPAWRNEEFAYYGPDGHEYFRLERAAFRTFGIQSQAAHINGFTSKNMLWFGRRSESKQIDPGKLDNLAAGGVNANETVTHCALRELWEEAAIPETVAQGICPAGKLMILRPHPPHGIHHENLFIFDLELPSHLVPVNHDGEVSRFIQLSLAEAVARILADEFTADAALVTADWILRRNRDHEAPYDHP